jgi:hypothetical protein
MVRPVIIAGDSSLSRPISPRPYGATMLRVKPRQIWERCSISGAVWRPLEVINVLGDQAELRFLDMPHASDLERAFTTSCRLCS